MGMTASPRMGLAVLACGILSACSVTTDGGDCVSHYDPVASVPTWDALRKRCWAPTSGVVSHRCGHRREATTWVRETRMPCAWWTYSAGTVDAWSKPMSGAPSRGRGVLGSGASASTDRESPAHQP